MPWVNEGPTVKRPEGSPESPVPLRKDLLRPFRPPRVGWLFYPGHRPPASAPGLESCDPLGRLSWQALRGGPRGRVGAPGG